MLINYMWALHHINNFNIEKNKKYMHIKSIEINNVCCGKSHKI